MTIVDLDRETIKRGLADGSIVLVDVREPHEFDAGHITGSVSLPLSVFDPGLLPEGRVVFTCAAGIRSARAAEFAQAFGRDIREHYRGGFKDWIGAGEPAEQSAIGFGAAASAMHHAQSPSSRASRCGD